MANLLHRRKFLIRAGLAVAAAPFIVRAASLMPVHAFAGSAPMTATAAQARMREMMRSWAEKVANPPLYGMSPGALSALPDARSIVRALTTPNIAWLSV